MLENLLALWNFESASLRATSPKQSNTSASIRAAPLPEGRKSVTFRIIAGAPDRTLSASEITALYSQISAGLTAIGYEFRS